MRGSKGESLTLCAHPPTLTHSPSLHRYAQRYTTLSSAGTHQTLYLRRLHSMSHTLPSTMSLPGAAPSSLCPPALTSVCTDRATSMSTSARGTRGLDWRFRGFLMLGAGVKAPEAGEMRGSVCQSGFSMLGRAQGACMSVGQGYSLKSGSGSAALEGRHDGCTSMLESQTKG